MTDKFQGFYDKMEGISIPQPFCSGFVPFALIINKVLDKIPGCEKLNIDAEGMKKKFGLLEMCIRDTSNILFFSYDSSPLSRKLN